MGWVSGAEALAGGIMRKAAAIHSTCSLLLSMSCPIWRKTHFGFYPVQGLLLWLKCLSLQAVEFGLLAAGIPAITSPQAH